MNALQHAVVHRLPQRYRWCAGLDGSAVEVLRLNPESEEALVGLRLLSQQGAPAWEVMRGLQLALADIQLAATVLEWEGEPCLFVQQHDEHATTCRLKNFGVGIAETFSGSV